MKHFLGGKKFVFFSPKISKFESSYKFGWPYVKKDKVFYSDKIDYINVKKTLDKSKISTKFMVKKNT